MRRFGHGARRGGEARAEREAPRAPHHAPHEREAGSRAGVPRFLQRSPERDAPAPGTLGPARALDAATRAAMEARLGADLGDVRIHTGPAAADAAFAAGAEAFAAGSDVAFAEGRFAPETEAGRRLLLHELAHVVQQRGPGGASAADGEAEREAERVARSGGRTRVRERTARRVARQKAGAAPKREDLEKKYGIKIIKGDRDWTDAELADLAWSLGRLSKEELAIVAGYDFQRWTTKEKRKEKDPNYTYSGSDECGLHELVLGGTTARISMYDACMADTATMNGVPMPRFQILHEVGHAAEMAQARKARKGLDAAQAKYDKAYDDAEAAIAAYNTANDERNALVEQHKNAGPDEQKKLAPKVKAAIAKAEKLSKKVDAAQAAVTALEGKRDQAAAATESALKAPGEAFAKLVEGQTPLTDYSKEGPEEAFAEAFALYKASPEELKKSNKALYDWFKAHGELTPAAKKK